MSLLETKSRTETVNTNQETPRFFGANAEAVDRNTAEDVNQEDFTARWWPGEMQQRMPPRKPR